MPTTRLAFDLDAFQAPPGPLASSPAWPAPASSDRTFRPCRFLKELQIVFRDRRIYISDIVRQCRAFGRFGFAHGDDLRTRGTDPSPHARAGRARTPCRLAAVAASACSFRLGVPASRDTATIQRRPVHSCRRRMSVCASCAEAPGARANSIEPSSKRDKMHVTLKRDLQLNVAWSRRLAPPRPRSGIAAIPARPLAPAAPEHASLRRPRGPSTAPDRPPRQARARVPGTLYFAIPNRGGAKLHQASADRRHRRAAPGSCPRRRAGAANP